MKTKEKIFNKKILLIIIILISIIILTKLIYAKYMTELNGDASADIAHFNFNVTANSFSDFTIDLGKTKTGITQVANVQDDYIGPGTAGKFEIVINASNNDTSLEYEINMNVDYENNNIFPKNLIFYYDKQMKNAIYHDNNKIKLNGYFSQKDSNKTKIQTIYWCWDYETGQTQSEKDLNDIADNNWIGKKISLEINVIGRQVSKDPTINQCQITYDTNGGIMDNYGNAEKITKTVTYNEPYGSIPNPHKEDCEFGGWYLNDNLISTNPDDWYNGALYSSGKENLDTPNRLCLKDYLKVNPSQNYTISTNSENSIAIRLIHFYDNNKRFISGFERVIDGFSPYIINFITPENCAYIKISLLYRDERDMTPDDITLANPYLEINNIIETSIVTPKLNHTLLAQWIDKSISINPTYWDNKGLTINGRETISYNRISLKNFVSISPNQNYTLTTNSNSSINIRIIHFYDNNKNYISCLQPNSNNFTFTTPENCAYIKISLMYLDDSPITPEAVIQANPCLVKN